jgi:hypothetical protein
MQKMFWDSLIDDICRCIVFLINSDLMTENHKKIFAQNLQIPD